jgi:hypothetical protein
MWNLIRTRHRREIFPTRSNNELKIGTFSCDLSDPTSSIVKVDEYNGSYTNETLDCRIVSIGSTRESAFVDCRFPELINLEIDRASRSTFIRCSFPKLRSIRIREGDEVFFSCSFARLSQDEVERKLFSNCRLEGVHPDYTYLYEGTSELDW